MEEKPVYLNAYSGTYSGSRKFSELLLEIDEFGNVVISDEDADIFLSVDVTELLSKLGGAVKKL